MAYFDQIAARRKGSVIRANVCSDGEAILVPTLLCLAMVIAATIAVSAAKLDPRPLFLPYVASSVVVTFATIPIFFFVEVAKLARTRADRPLARVAGQLSERAPLMLLPIVVFPIFLIGYTAAKSAIPFLVGYTWDGFWAHADRLIFGDDVWHLTRRVLGNSHSHIWEWLYSVGWGGVFLFSGNVIALYAPRRSVGVFFSAMFATWLFGGCFLAYAFSAAGPVFAHVFDPTLDTQFKPLRDALAASLGNSPIGFTQQYLANAVHSHIAVKGGGISAMPSMHLGAASVYVLAARGTRWLSAALLFWLTIFVASGYFGYHYWVDGLAAAVIATGSWYAADTAYSHICKPALAPVSRAEVLLS